ncbi:50S ribosomal protein L34e [Sulfuracidifex tepidarius]|uniref:Large ribosomal subunit protein eL34 n=1 Tax=Sulfuracidifex tepidarius TaxID=1294262 RepID=A0A510E3P0_9CREN|nr:50S ribosomal protein L34e [Sulfuracidifex tepidarius]BBG24377.1 50S ribosomal protein L34e [Sulfuracidifex tepidarius]BBG27135.1 50S ribosomal protein L34e [Sulfuracidifex tepidarius]
MPKPFLRSRSLSRKRVKLPSGNIATHYEDKRNSSSTCHFCGKPLHGAKTNKLSKFSKSERRPSRPFAGVLCHSCLERLIKQTSRGSL